MRNLIILILCVSVFSVSETSAFDLDTLDFDGDGIEDTKYVKEIGHVGKSILKKESDLNRDNKPDFWTTYQSDILTLYEWDRNFDGKVDKKELRSASGEVTFEEDTDFDGLYDWRKTYSLKTKASAKYTVKVEKRVSKARAYRLVFVKEIPKIESDEIIEGGLCNFTEEDLLSIRQFDIFAEILDYNLAKGRTRGGTFTTPYGQVIDTACFDIFGKVPFLRMVQRAVTEGAACLQRLNTPQSTEHLHKLADLLNGRMGGPRIDCQTNAVDRNWGENTLARGTIGVGDMWIRPDYKEKFFDKEDDAATAETNLASTIFHEMLHNIGYPHNEGVEYVYSCQRCCHRDVGDKMSQTETACNICKSSYSQNEQVEYLRQLDDITSFSPGIDFDKSLNSILIQNADNPEMLMYLYEESSDDIYEGLGRSRAIHQILQNLSIPLSPEAQATYSNQYIPYENYFKEEEGGGAKEEMAVAHALGFEFLYLKTKFQKISWRDRDRRDERRELANQMYDTFLELDIGSIDNLSGEDELELRESAQRMLKTTLEAYEDAFKRQKLMRAIRKPRVGSHLITRFQQLKRVFNNNRRRIEELNQD